MKQLKFIVLAGLAAVLVSGCASGIDTASVAGMQTTRDAFKSALHKEYVSLAKAEQEEGDTDDTKFFINKAKDAIKNAEENKVTKGSHHVRKTVKKVDNVRFGRPPPLNG